MNSIPIKVLVIDDESPIRKLLRMGLSAQGYDVVEAQDGKIALELLRRLLLGGVGWCGMPEPLVRADIESKRLVRLNLPEWRGGEYTLQAVHKIDMPPGPAGRWLIERLATLSDAVEVPLRDSKKPIKGKGRRRVMAGSNR